MFTAVHPHTLVSPTDETAPAAPEQFDHNLPNTKYVRICQNSKEKAKDVIYYRNTDELYFELWDLGYAF